MPNQVEQIPVLLSTPDDAFGGPLIGTAVVTQYGTLTITIPPNTLTQEVPYLADLNQIVGISIGLQYKAAAPIEKE